MNRSFIHTVLLLIALVASSIAMAQTAESYDSKIDGYSFRVDSSCRTVDSIFNTPDYLTQITTTYLVRNSIILELVDNDSVVFPDSFSVDVNIAIDWTDSNHILNHDYKTLRVEYNNRNLIQDTLRSFYGFMGGHEVVVRITGITAHNITAPLPNIIRLVNRMELFRDYLALCGGVTVLEVDTSYITDQNELLISWIDLSTYANMHGSNILYSTADEYDVEWTFYDDSSQVAREYYATNILPYSEDIFRNNCSRATIRNTSYQLPLIYEKGILIYRIRAVRMIGAGIRVPGAWTNVGSGNLLYRVAGHEEHLNWQSKTSYAEEGKRKSVVNYYDGASHSRQIVTKINTDSTAIVAETIYDWEGRPVINTLPAPTIDKLIKHFDLFNKDVQGDPYTWKDLDSLTNGCNNPAKVMSTISGVSQYYSPHNPYVASGFNQYIPDAFGYPFSQTAYTSDLTNRIRISGGPGKDHKMGTEHVTTYYYGGAEKSELQRLFGDEAGMASHYFKNLVEDPNGQVSVTYQDMHGRTVATALAGYPSPLDSVQLDTLPDFRGDTILRDALLDTTNNQIDGTSIISTKTYTASTAGNFIFKYCLFPDHFSMNSCDTSHFCFSCIYDLKIIITDECNNKKMPGGVPYVRVDSNYTFSGVLPYYFDTACGDAPIIDSFMLTLPIGEYTVTKQLSIKKEAIDFYFQCYLRKDTCLQTFDHFYRDALQDIDVEGCEIICSACLDRLGDSTTFCANFLNKLRNEDSTRILAASDTFNAYFAYQELKHACDMLCDSFDICEHKRAMMLADMSPGGQYGAYTLDSLSEVFASGDSTSIFFNADGSIFSHHPLYSDSSIVYHKDNGEPDYVTVDLNHDGIADTLRPNSLNPVQFVQYWRPSWAEALLPYHPEYCYYQYCVANSASNAYDEWLRSINEYDTAVYHGLINPLNMPFDSCGQDPNPDHQDPFFTAGGLDFSANERFKERLMRFYSYPVVNLMTSLTETRVSSIWTISNLMMDCSDPSCTNCMKNYYWNAFRNIYLGLKKIEGDSIMMVWADNNCHTNPPNPNSTFDDPIFRNKERRFEIKTSANAYAPLTSMDTIEARRLGDSLVADMPTFRCSDYASYWWNQLKGCGFSDMDSAALIREMVAVCDSGIDIGHPMGASSVRSGAVTANGNHNFEEVLDWYDSHNTWDYHSSDSCTSLLITNPLPNSASPMYYQTAQIDRPEECVCAKINREYHHFRFDSATYGTLSNYLWVKKQISISENDIRILVKSCDSSNVCQRLPHPVALPYQFGCNMVCANCYQIITAYNNFLSKFPGVYASPNYFTLMQASMNGELGMNLTVSEYFSFMADSCHYADFPYRDTVPCRGPVAADDNVYIGYLQPVTIPVTVNDRPNGGVAINIIKHGIYGTDALPGNSIFYSPFAGYEEDHIDTLIYTACNDCNNISCDTASVYIHISHSVKQYRSPLVVRDSITVCKDSTLAINPVLNDTTRDDSSLHLAGAVVLGGGAVATISTLADYVVGHMHQAGPQQVAYNVCTSDPVPQCTTGFIYVTVTDCGIGARMASAKTTSGKSMQAGREPAVMPLAAKQEYRGGYSTSNDMPGYADDIQRLIALGKTARGDKQHLAGADIFSRMLADVRKESGWLDKPGTATRLVPGRKTPAYDRALKVNTLPVRSRMADYLRKQNPEWIQSDKAVMATPDPARHISGARAGLMEAHGVALSGSTWCDSMQDAVDLYVADGGLLVNGSISDWLNAQIGAAYVPPIYNGYASWKSEMAVCGITCEWVSDCDTLHARLNRFYSEYPAGHDSCNPQVIASYLSGLYFDNLILDDGQMGYAEWSDMAACCGVAFPDMTIYPTHCDTLAMTALILHHFEHIISIDSCLPAAFWTYLVHISMDTGMNIARFNTELMGCSNIPPIPYCTGVAVTHCDSVRHVTAILDAISVFLNEENGVSGDMANFYGIEFGVSKTPAEIMHEITACDTGLCVPVIYTLAYVDSVLGGDCYHASEFVAAMNGFTGYHYTAEEWCARVTACGRSCRAFCPDTHSSCDSVAAAYTIYLAALGGGPDDGALLSATFTSYFGYPVSMSRALTLTFLCLSDSPCVNLRPVNDVIDAVVHSYGPCIPAPVLVALFNGLTENQDLFDLGDVCTFEEYCRDSCFVVCPGPETPCDSILMVVTAWGHILDALPGASTGTLEALGREMLHDYTITYDTILARALRCDTGTVNPCVLTDTIRRQVAAFMASHPGVQYAANLTDLLQHYLDSTLRTYAMLHLHPQPRPGDTIDWCSILTACGDSCPRPVPSPELCNRPMLPPVDARYTDSCNWQMEDYAFMNATAAYGAYMDALRDSFEDRYVSKCLGAYRLEHFDYWHPNSEYHYTLYYYDQAGNLVKTIPPAGVDLYTQHHTMATRYRYNTLNQVVEQMTPDAGHTLMWYDLIGKVQLSQNARQKPLNQFSYTKYDRLERITEVGKWDGLNTTNYALLDSFVTDSLWYQTLALGTRSEVTRTYYDYDTLHIHDTLGVAESEYLRNRVASTTYTDVLDLSDIHHYNSGTHYRYDIHGNVNMLLQENTGLRRIGQQWKRLDYAYDLISGKVNQVIYQQGKPDMYIHQYEYDADNRLTDVRTTRDSVIWDHDASYSYYKHGPLARMEIGDQKVQAENYVYTIQGWIKGVNGLDPLHNVAKDGTSSGPNRIVGRSAMGYALTYYKGDYQPINAIGTIQNSVEATYGNLNIRSLYNGNIALMQVNIPKVGQAQAYKYRYDQLNRLTGMEAYDGLTGASGFTPANWSHSSPLSAYAERVNYDPNGNISFYNRHGNSATNINMDSMIYRYLPGTNKLDHVDDAVSATNYSVDIDDQDTLNYRYDQIGNLTKDKSEGIDSIYWNLYGKIQEIDKRNGDTIKFAYDPMGHRIMKEVYKDTTHRKKGTYYVHDATGNIMATYDWQDRDTFKLGELMMYGSSRLGSYEADLLICDTVNNDSLTYAATRLTGSSLTNYINYHTYGVKRYELSNHLGNVLATITDRHIPTYSGSVLSYYNADVASAQDYYPFGMQMPGRTFSAGYRFGFNGKEKDDELNGGGNNLDFLARIYDSRTGRFLNIDPEFRKYASLSGYNFVANNPINFIDVTGKTITNTSIDATEHQEIDDLLEVLKHIDAVKYEAMQLSPVEYRIHYGAIKQDIEYNGTTQATTQPLYNTGNERLSVTPHKDDKGQLNDGSINRTLSAEEQTAMRDNASKQNLLNVNNDVHECISDDQAKKILSISYIDVTINKDLRVKKEGMNNDFNFESRLVAANHDFFGHAYYLGTNLIMGFIWFNITQKDPNLGSGHDPQNPSGKESMAAERKIPNAFKLSKIIVQIAKEKKQKTLTPSK